MLFTTPGRCRTQAGEQAVPAGTCLLFAPGQAQHYGSDGAPFANHWCHWRGPAAGGLAAALRLPLATPIPLADPAAVARAIRDLEREHRRREPGWATACAAGVLLTLVTVARGLRPARRRAADRRLHDLRAEMLAAPQRPWGVPRLACAAGLSASRLSARWRSAFGASPIADLIAARLSRARLLIEAGSTVAAAAEASGFRDLAYFHRRFRREIGCTPARCRG